MIKTPDMRPIRLRWVPATGVIGTGPGMSEKLIDSVFERLEELRRDAGEEQSKEIREVQQLVVGVEESVETDEE